MKEDKSGRPWTGHEESWLVANYDKHTLKEMSVMLGRSRHAVLVKASELRKYGAPIAKSPKPSAIEKAMNKYPQLDIPSGNADGYWMEVTNAYGKVIGVYTVKSVDQLKIISTQYYGMKYNYRIRRIINKEVIWKEEK